MAEGDPEVPKERRSRVRPGEEDDPLLTSQQNANTNRALLAYRCCCIGLIPPLGLVLAPLGILLALLAALRGRNDPDFKGRMLVRASVMLGAALTVTNWLGVTFMILGLQQ